jgi:hypothetical protein
MIALIECFAAKYIAVACILWGFSSLLDRCAAASSTVYDIATAKAKCMTSYQVRTFLMWIWGNAWRAAHVHYI